MPNKSPGGEEQGSPPPSFHATSTTALSKGMRGIGMTRAMSARSARAGQASDGLNDINYAELKVGDSGQTGPGHTYRSSMKANLGGFGGGMQVAAAIGPRRRPANHIEN